MSAPRATQAPTPFGGFIAKLTEDLEPNGVAEANLGAWDGNTFVETNQKVHVRDWFLDANTTITTDGEGDGWVAGIIVSGVYLVFISHCTNIESTLG